MSTHIIFIYILVVHFIADFVLQTHKQATGKGEGFSLWNKQLFYHVGIYSSVWFIPSLLLNIDAGAFVLITFICHYMTDWWTSRWGKPYWKKGDFHNGFVIVGFDQILHYIQLWFTFHYLSN